VGTRILRHALTIADERRLPVRLEYLKWNPVGSLYHLRNGFVRTHETDIHVFLSVRQTRLWSRNLAAALMCRCGETAWNLHILLSGANLATPHLF